MILSDEERAKRKRALEAKEESLEHEMLTDVQSTKQLTALQALDASIEPAAKKAKVSKWKKMESKTTPGAFYYYNKETGNTSMEKPDDFVEETKWQRKESKSNPGEFYYYNTETGESVVDEPGELKSKKEVGKVEGRWKRTESSSRPGHFFYFNPKTGMNEIDPPRVDPPWELKESNSKKGQFYYFNADTGVTQVDPPLGARPAGTKRPGALKQAPVLPVAKTWERKMSETHKKPYWVNTKTGETVWTKPAEQSSEATEKGEWKKHESKSNPGVFYYMHTKTGETSWDSK